MNAKSNLIAALVLGTSLLAVTAAANASTANRPPLDTPSMVDGIKVACAGVAERDRTDRRWRNYAVRLEAVGGYGQFLGDEDVTVKKPDGDAVAQFSCGGPWALMDLSPGRYRVAMSVPDSPLRDLRVVAPEHGEKTIIVRFKSHMAGEPGHRHMAENDTTSKL